MGKEQKRPSPDLCNKAMKGNQMNFLLPLTGSFAMPAAENPTVAMIEAAYHHHGLDLALLEL